MGDMDPIHPGRFEAMRGKPARAEALVEVQKKLSELLGIEPPPSDERS